MLAQLVVVLALVPPQRMVRSARSAARGPQLLQQQRPPRLAGYAYARRTPGVLLTTTEPNSQSFPEATGTLLGAITLVAGTTVGAGILALPAKTLAAGFPPSAAALVASWAFMASSGLLIAEVNVNTLCSLERSAVSMTSMTSETLGDGASRFSGFVYVVLHYLLLVAYMIQGGALLLEIGAGASLADVALAGPPAFVALLGSILFFGKQAQLERFNSTLFAGLIAVFGVLLSLGLTQLDTSLLLRSDPVAVVPAVPVLVLSLVYHNVVPTICYQLGCDLPRIRTAILVGSAVPAAMFVAWNAIILGALPYDPDAVSAAAASGQVFDPLQALRSSGDFFGLTVRAFSILAIATSFNGFVFGLRDFFADALGWEPALAQQLESSGGSAEVGEALPQTSDGEYETGQKAVLFALVLLPPLAVSLSDPSLFFSALDNAGTFGVLVLFGIIPPLMAWQQRYGEDASPVAPPALPGGRATLVAMATFAASIVAGETWERLASVMSLVPA